MKKTIALAPMDGITNNAYRTICRQIRENQKNTLNQIYSLYRFTEFMSCEGYIRNPKKLSRHLLTTQHEANTIAQIYGGEHDHLLQTAIDIDNKYTEFNGIELNIGCPSPKIMACEAGSGMLKCRPKTLELIRKISSAIKRPFSIKTRTGLGKDDRQDQIDFIIESAYYCSMITIHGRTYKQGHSGSVDRDFIQTIKSELTKRNLKNVIIIGNGGLKGVDDGLLYLEKIDGIMLGQAAMCSPRALTNYKPDIQEIYDVTIKHLHLSLANEHYFNKDQVFDENTNTLIQPSSEILNEIITELVASRSQIAASKRFSLIEFRKHLFRYACGLPGNSEFKRKAALITDYRQLIDHIHSFFLPLLCQKDKISL